MAATKDQHEFLPEDQPENRVAKQAETEILLLLERRQPAHPLASPVWTLLSYFEPGEEVALPPEAHLLRTQIELHHTELTAYVYNLECPEPSLFVVLRPDELDESAVPKIHLATLSPYEAQDYLDSGEELVERLPLRPALEGWLRGFVDAHYKEEAFKKRQRDKAGKGDDKFGKTPIFVKGRDRLNY